MTNCIVIPSATKKIEAETPKLKPITFFKCFNYDLTLGAICFCPGDWNVVELITKEYFLIGGNKYDLILAYSNNRNSNPSLYLGNWNDGVVG